MDSTTLRILILEDEAAHAEALLRSLKAADLTNGIQVVTTLKAYRAAVAANPPDISLLDLNLPDGRAVEVLVFPPEEGRFPVLVMTGYGTEETAVEALKAGALDYIVKSPEAFSALPRTIQRVMREWELLQERKRTQQMLHENEQLLSAMLDSLPIGVWVLDTNGKIIRSNPEARNLWSNVTSVFYNHSTDDHSRWLNTPPSLEHNEWPGLGISDTCWPILDQEAEIRYTDGTRKILLVSAVSMCNAERKNTGTVIISHDITRRRIAEDTLKQSEQRLRDLSGRLLTAQEDERKRIAGEIHDSLGSLLSIIKLKAEGALRGISQKSGRDTDTAASIQTLLPVIQESIEECRRIQMDLRPAILDDLGIVAALSWFCRRFQKMCSEIRIRQTLMLREEQVSDVLKITIFRITQEALNNVAKHSQANQVQLSLIQQDQSVELIISDNGQGFNVQQMQSSDGSKRGLGLSSMRERAELSGGRLQIESNKEEGTIIRVWWNTATGISKTGT
ncbi:MAG TPA: response regulator [Thermodesulfobacteriota bacterium]|nr:response regulator [Deltaproteobacteria bacterium]HNR14375.1 response regulator [Thermodesulfobacteriota bacterium]HOC37695.1 response regulator [Thermodesulfobacteriota bacterium]